STVGGGSPPRAGRLLGGSAGGSGGAGRPLPPRKPNPLPGPPRQATFRARPRLCLLALCAIVPAGDATAASFDCAKATTAVEKMICADPALSQADERLAEAYKQAMSATLASQSSRRAQFRWLADRNEAKTAAALLDSYQRRIAMLTEQAGQWRALRREVSETAAREACIVLPDPPDGTCRIEEYGVVAGSHDALTFQLQTYQAPQYRAGGG